MRPYRMIAAVALIGLSCVTQPASADDSPVTSGATLAKQKCNSCHRIGPDDAGKNAKPAAFADFAARTPSEQLGSALEAALKKIHTGFTKLSEAEAVAIAAYIDSLRANPEK